MNFTGNIALLNLRIHLGARNNGVKATHKGTQVHSCQFIGEDLITPATALEIGDGISTCGWPHLKENYFLGEGPTHMTALKLRKTTAAFITGFEVAKCKVGLHFSGAGTDLNVLNGAGIDVCGTGIQIDAGNNQYFQNLRLNGNMANVVDAVGNSIWHNIQGEFPLTTEPENPTGVVIPAGDGAWGADTELRSAAAATTPFKVLTYNLQTSADENTLIRFSADSGVTFFATDIFAAKKNKATGGGDATDFIFNAGTRISASVWAPAAGREVNVWLEIQKI